MDDRRKFAYRHLIYWAMLHIRGIQWFGGRGWRAWNPLAWRRDRRFVRCAGAVADWLHNLANYSAHDFRGFDEEWFWREFEAMRARHPEFGLEHYRETFDRYATPPPEVPPDAAAV